MLLITDGALGSMGFETVVLAFDPGTTRLPMCHLIIWLSASALT